MDQDSSSFLHDADFWFKVITGSFIFLEMTLVVTALVIICINLNQITGHQADFDKTYQSSARGIVSHPAPKH